MSLYRDALKRLMSTTARKPNRLAQAKSPYLLQHKFNPVDWYPWCDEAIQRARKENKPIFLSVGYSTCHWCHVMEKNSFEDEETASLMNSLYINIKVDREERPDIDKTYMTYLVSTSGGGGWPMSIFLEPKSLIPIFCGTYFPPDDAPTSTGNRIGFKSLLRLVSSHWSRNPEAIVRKGSFLVDHIKKSLLSSAMARSKSSKPYYHYLEMLSANVSKIYDENHGGWGEEPKFPTPPLIEALLIYYVHSKSAQILSQCKNTLISMAHGGIYDHVGGGFHRYSVSADWKIPHFEKMLYDQAQLAVVYLRMYQLTGDSFFSTVAKNVLDYVKVRLRDTETGGFYGAEDADSRPPPDHPLYDDGESGLDDGLGTTGLRRSGVEGAFYVWKSQSLQKILKGHRYDMFSEVFDIHEAGNIPSKYSTHGEFAGMNVLHRVCSDAEVAQKYGVSVEYVKDSVDACLVLLSRARETRCRPHLDDKMVTSWNALAITAFSIGFQVLGDKEYLEIALKAVEFIKAQFYSPEDRRLLRTYRNGPGEVEAFADDYSFLVLALTHLYESTLDEMHLRFAQELQALMDERFWDEENGGYHYDRTEELPFFGRKEWQDGAEPSNNSVAALGLVRLARLVRDGGERYAIRAKTLLQAFQDQMDKSVVSLPTMCIALWVLEQSPQLVTIYGDKSLPRLVDMVATVHRKFDPRTVLVWREGQGPIKGKEVSAVVCRNESCSEPIKSADELLRHL